MVELTSETALKMTAVPWLEKVVSKTCIQFWGSAVADLYPPETILALGHLVLAISNMRFASSMAALVVPAGSALGASSASYGEPMPCTQMSLRKLLSRPLATLGPALEPYSSVSLAL